MRREASGKHLGGFWETSGRHLGSSRRFPETSGGQGAPLQEAPIHKNRCHSRREYKTVLKLLTLHVGFVGQITKYCKLQSKMTCGRSGRSCTQIKACYTTPLEPLQINLFGECRKFPGTSCSGKTKPAGMPTTSHRGWRGEWAIDLNWSHSHGSHILAKQAPMTCHIRRSK